MEEEKQIQTIFATVVKSLRSENADLFIYSGQIHPRLVKQAQDQILAIEGRRKNLYLFLSTYGGDPHSAYRLARTFQNYYVDGVIRIYIYVPCKSAGTLVALCGHELVINDFGELGPIDTQLPKDDDIIYSSGLDVDEAIGQLTNQTYSVFTNYFHQIKDLAPGITVRTSMDIARQMATDSFAPIMSQIEPLRIGETARALSILKEYGQRIIDRNAKVKDKSLASPMVKRLSADYPSHSFVIDMHEASEIFETIGVPVRSARDEGVELYEVFMGIIFNLLINPRAGITGYAYDLAPFVFENSTKREDDSELATEDMESDGHDTTLRNVPPNEGGSSDDPTATDPPHSDS